MIGRISHFLGMTGQAGAIFRIVCETKPAAGRVAMQAIHLP
jgi:hypothetical protein